MSACLSSRNQAPDLPRPTMVLVPGGTFTMGDVFDFEDTDATPVHPATVDAFFLSNTETTYEQYDAYAVHYGLPLPESNGQVRGRRAVTNVTWFEADRYCKSHGFRLPSEIEWEYAARSGGKMERYSGTNTRENADEYVRHQDNGDREATYVGTKKPNGLGLYDLSGNVFEWIGPYYQFYPSEQHQIKYTALDSSDMRIIRGGSFLNPIHIAQTFWRAGTLAGTRSDMIGFRCAVDSVSYRR